MARKHLLSELGVDKLPAGNSGAANDVVRAPETPKPQPSGNISGSTRGAIGAVTRSLEQLRAQGIVEISPDAIDASPISDRLPGTAEGHAELVASIRDFGQQVPILVRPHPKLEGRYQIAFGRRRLRAIAELGMLVRSVVKPLTDEQLVIAQGMENSARADLSFIERALFAASLEEGGYRRETIMAALSVDKTGLSRLISSASRIPRDIILAVGPAPKAGRDRWVELASRLANPGAKARAEALTRDEAFLQKPSDERFTMLMERISPRQGRSATPEVIKARDGTQLARIREEGRATTLILDKKSGFAAYLLEKLPDIYATFKGGSVA